MPRQGPARPAPARDPTAPRQPRTRLQWTGMLEGIHPIAEPPARSGAGPAPLSEPVSDLRAEHGPRPSPKSALDPRERRARLSDRMDAGGSRRPCNRSARSVPRSPLSERVDWQHVGKPTWVAPEGPDRSFFLKCTAVSTQPSVWWRLAAQLVAGAPGPAPSRERYAGRAFGSEVPGAHHSRHWPQGAGGRGNPGHLWH